MGEIEVKLIFIALCYILAMLTALTVSLNIRRL